MSKENFEEIENNVFNEKHVAKNWKGDTLCKDSISGGYFWSTPRKLYTAKYLLVSHIKHNKSASLNMWYSLLGIKGIASRIGDIVEWTEYTGFGIYLSVALAPDKRPCICVEYRSKPEGDLFVNDINSWSQAMTEETADVQ